VIYDELIIENESLRAENLALQQRISELEAALKATLEELEAARRAGKRQAAPFSKGQRKPNPKRPGRPKGHAPAHRQTPTRIDRVLDVPLNHTRCLKCGGELQDHTIQVQYQVEIPKVQPHVTQFNIASARCTRCGQRAQARHAEQTSDALGAAAVQIGPQAIALATEMKHSLGVPYRKVGRVLSAAMGLEVSPAALARAGHRLASKAEPTYQHLILAIRESQVVNGDETGWKIGGENAWLWVFTSAGATVYVIDKRRSHEVAERILGTDFQGILTCDCFLAYDPLPYRQHKCTGHLLKRCKEMQTIQQGQAAQLSQRVARLLRGAITLHARRGQMTLERYSQARERLEKALDRILAGEQGDPENARLVKLLQKHRSRLLTFLYVDGLEPTNNAAERAIRPAVVVRKISAGNRSSRGARAHAILTSILRTCQQQGRDFLAVAVELLRAPVPSVIPLVKPQPKGLSP
jgi:transposase